MPDSLGGIITNSMGSDHNGMILGSFHLKIFVKVVDVTRRPGGSGGALDRYTDDNYKDEEPKKIVYLMVKMGDTVIERRYIVSKQRSDKIVNVTNWVNRTLENMRLRVSDFKKKIGTITVKFKNDE